MITFEQQYFGNSLMAWLIALGILIGTMLILKVVQKIIVHRMGRFAVGTKTEIDDMLVEMMARHGSSSCLLLPCTHVPTASCFPTKDRDCCRQCLC